MTFLELCRRAARECGITTSGSVPSIVTSQTGDLLDIVSWVNDAWRELQVSKKSWLWMQSRFTFNTAASTEEYAYTAVTDSVASATISRLQEWLIRDRRNPAKAYLTSGGIGSQYALRYLPWEDFESVYHTGTVNPGMPLHITVTPQRKLALGPTPNAIYTVTGSYQKSAQTLTADADEPEMPSDYHMVIVYDVMRKYAGKENAVEVLARHETEGESLKSALKLDQLPRFRDGIPLA